MNWFSRTWNRLFGGDGNEKPAPGRNHRPSPGRQSRYDAAATTDENRNLWRGADNLSANAANDRSVRAKLRSRSRYEDDNNGYFNALIEGRANETIGTSPRLQLTIPAVDDSDEAAETANDLARQVELLYADWAEMIGLPDKLWVMDTTETRDGEVFGLYHTNARLPETGPQLDLLVIEADQVATPGMDIAPPGVVDGIRVDAYGNAVAYDILKNHPGDLSLGGFAATGQYTTADAEDVIHLFRRKRPSQARAVPPLTPGLPLFGQMRRFTGATVTAAEVAAMIVAYITEKGPGADFGNTDPNAPGDEDDFDQIPFTRGMITKLPSDQDIKAFQPAQPIPAYGTFKSEILTEAGRGIQAPRLISTGSAAEYNYSSGRLDRQQYDQSLRLRRDRWRRMVLDRTFWKWLAEAELVPGYLPAGLPDPRTWRVRWQWNAMVSIDPVKDATADQIRLQSGTTTLERICAERGEDYEEVLEQQAREMRIRRRLGLPDPSGNQSVTMRKPNEPAPGTTDGNQGDTTEDGNV